MEKTTTKLTRSRLLRSEYKKWKILGLQAYGYFPVFNGFAVSHLSDMSGNALKLYIYLGIQARNRTGESWHSEDRIASFFGVDPRTVRNWMRELKARGLIERLQFTFNGPTYTYLRPYDHAEAIPELQASVMAAAAGVRDATKRPGGGHEVP